LGPVSADEQDSEPQLDQERYLAATGDSEHCYIEVQIGVETLDALLDTGAAGNFMSERTADRLGLIRKTREEPWQIKALDGRTITTCTEEAECTMHLAGDNIPFSAYGPEGHTEEIRFDIIPLGPYDLVLGAPWMRRHSVQLTMSDIRYHMSNYIAVGCTRAHQPGDCTGGKAFQHTKHISNQGWATPSAEKTTQDTTLGVTTRARLRLRNQAEVPEKPDTTIITEAGPGQNPWTPYTVSDEELIPEDEWNQMLADTVLPSEYKEYEELFNPVTEITELPTHQPWDHKIPLELGAKPKFGPIYRLSAKELEVLRKYIKDNLARGFIQESESPAGYPILFALKKEPGKLRLCVDYRSLNDITIKNRYALPLISELQDRIVGATIFTRFDLWEAYHLIRIAAGEEWKTAFRTRYGHYEYKVMPFGLANAPATFQALINNALRPYLDKFAVAYLDDILIYSKTEKEHVEHVRLVLGALRKFFLRINLKKSVFHRESVEFLGYIISSKGLGMQMSKVQAILEWPPLQNVKDVQSFMGLANYYRRFIGGFQLW
jgi:hypothetical protein